MYGKKIKVICCSILMIGTILTFTGCSDSAFNSSQLSESSQLSQPDESVVSSELTNSSSEPVTDSDTVIENTEDAQNWHLVKYCGMLICMVSFPMAKLWNKRIISLVFRGREQFCYL